MWSRGASSEFGRVLLNRTITASSQEEHCVEGNCTQSPGGSTKLNLFEPPYLVSV